ncbi:MAG TPA: transporter substrate-binding domain-containing protein [Coriobacteriia bacterium]|jgi:polar amino acid transport system substrate-binding protein
MAKYGKLFGLLTIAALVVSVLALAGCTTPAPTTSTTTTATTTPAPAGIMSTDDLKSGDRVGVQSGTTGEKWVKDNLVPKGIVSVPFDDVLAAFQALQAGDVKAVVNDMPISLDVAKDPARGLAVVQEIPTNEAYGFAFNKKNTALRDAVDWGLAQVIASGEYNTIYKTWFGAEPASLPTLTSNAAKPASAPKTLTAGKIVVGSDTAFPPFENVVNGKTEGFDVDLVAAIGKQIGLATEFKSFKFDALITGLQTGSEFDMVASGMTITAERAKQINFSDPYINSNQSLTVKKAQ